MKRSLLDILCCPVCKGDLLIEVSSEDQDEIMEGRLTCPECCVEYPITEGIPDLLPRDPACRQ
jgi:uncharacterized protein